MSAKKPSFNRCAFGRTLLIFLMGAAWLPAGSISYSDFSSLSGLALVGNAAQSGSAMRLTGSGPSQVGGVWLDSQIPVAAGFDATFNFRISSTGGAQDFAGSSGGDGFAFVVQNESATALGAANGGMGYYGISNSLAVEFDTWMNAPNYYDPDGNHVGIMSMGLQPNRPEHNLAGLGVAGLPRNLKDGSVQTARVLYSSGFMSIYVNDLSTAALVVPVDLSALLNLNGGSAWVGFTASTGGAWENHDLLSASVVSAPELSSVLLVSAGIGLMLLSRQKMGRR